MKLRFACLAALIAHCPDNPLSADLKIPMAEEYLSGGRIPAYSEDAGAYLEKTPKAPLTPRLANSPDWPNLPVEEREEFDFASFMGLIGSFMDSFSK
jgi:hypothetical protein